MIETRIIKTHFTAESFAIGKIARSPQGNSLFLFDTRKTEVIQLSLDPEHKILTTLNLNIINGVQQPEPLQQIDCIFFAHHHLVIADSLSEKLFKYPLKFDKQGAASLQPPTLFPLKNRAVIVSAVFFSNRGRAAANDDEYLLLDKGNSIIRIYDGEFRETRTVGSRMGYVMAYTQEVELRLGYEIPEDMVISKETPHGKRKLLISDSGNKRLLVILLDPDSTTPYKLEQVIPLPEFPFKIICWDEENDRIVVSDFDRSVMMASLRYGFIAMQESQLALDFFPATYNQEKRTAYVADEEGKLLEISPVSTPLETIARGTGNLEAVIKMMADQKRFAEAQQLVKINSQLLPIYMAYIPDGDKTFDEPLTTFIDETFSRITADNKALAKEIGKLSEAFIMKYKSIPDSDDVEAANIDKENIRHRMFLKLKKHRNNIKELMHLHKVVANSLPAAKRLKQLQEQRFEQLKTELTKQIENIEANLSQYNELELLNTIVNYCLIEEEETTLFKQQELKYEKPFAATFLLAFLNNFYYNIAEMFLKRNKVAQYISFADREITMYQEKTSIFMQFCNSLIKLRKYDDVLRMLAKVPDRNKELINYTYYQVYLAKGDLETAFLHLKQELDLYPHRANLLPALFNLNRLSDAEIRQYIENILEKSDQGIDVYCNAAKALKSIGKFQESEFYIDRELQQYPENTAALILKRDLFLMHPLNAMSPDYYRRCLHQLKDFLTFSHDPYGASQIMPLFSVLNHVVMEQQELEELYVVWKTINTEQCKKELGIFLSYNKHPQFEPLPKETYLSAYCTEKLAYDHYVEECKQLHRQGDMEKMFEMIEMLLKYNPGDQKIYQFLDRLSK